MKKLIYLFSITIALSVLTSVSAKAATTITSYSSSSDQSLLSDLLDLLGFGGNSNSGSSYSGSNHNNSGTTAGTQLPINNGVVFLLIAGVTIGITTVRKYRVAPIENHI
jgi:hypothetical protein